MSTDHAAKVAPLLSPFSLTVFWVALLSIMTWSSISITKLTHEMNVSWWLAWIPAVATDGAMLVATGWCVNHLLDRTIRLYAAGIAFTGIVGSVVVAAIEHYVTAAQITPRPELAALVGGIPSLMAALLVHVFAMIQAQQKRQQEELASAHVDLATAKGVRTVADREIAEADRLRQEAHRRGLKEDAENRQERHATAVADATRLQQELLQAEVDAATRSQHGLQQECDKVAVLQAELDGQRATAEVTKQEAEALLRGAVQDREQAGQVRSDAANDRAAAEEDQREAERIRSRLRRRNSATVSQPVLQQDPTLSQTASRPLLQQRPAASQTASRDDRRRWARQQILSGEWEREHGRELRGADIDRHFGGPRTGAAILQEINAAVQAELEAMTSGFDESRPNRS